MWTYRMWLTETFGLWENERKMIAVSLEENPTNNSAWSYRHFLMLHGADYVKVAEKEAEFAMKEITSNVVNECAWVYLKGLLLATPKRSAGDVGAALELAEKLKVLVEEYCEKVFAVDSSNRFAGAMLIDLWKHDKKNKERVMKMCDRLAKADGIRKNYWMWLKERFETEMENPAESTDSREDAKQ
eukprot:TRINITY_DN2398_c0_g1_i1.p1 TRINITY_DN2398_c0_g1~~TRINITY_DN2398_c0_g1_i1.p1  ORF type:complete len:186 (-),score=55.08 TRINITY_DN2398_c0_g1_i1:127-684(-)